MLRRLFNITLLGTQIVAVTVLATTIAIYVGTKYFGFQLQDRGLSNPWASDRVAERGTDAGGIAGMDVVTINRFHVRIVDQDTGREMANFDLNPAIEALRATVGPLTANELLLIFAAFLIIASLLIKRR